MLYVKFHHCLYIREGFTIFRKTSIYRQWTINPCLIHTGTILTYPEQCFSMTILCTVEAIQKGSVSRHVRIHVYTATVINTHIDNVSSTLDVTVSWGKSEGGIRLWTPQIDSMF